MCRMLSQSQGDECVGGRTSGQNGNQGTDEDTDEDTGSQLGLVQLRNDVGSNARAPSALAL